MTIKLYNKMDHIDNPQSMNVIPVNEYTKEAIKQGASLYGTEYIQDAGNANIESVVFWEFVTIDRHYVMLAVVGVDVEFSYAYWYPIYYDMVRGNDGLLYPVKYATATVVFTNGPTFYQKYINKDVLYNTFGWFNVWGAYWYNEALSKHTTSLIHTCDYDGAITTVDYR